MKTVIEPTKLKAYLSLLVFAIAAMLLYSCATIMHGSKQEVGISSNPTGANVMIDDQDKGVTPIVEKLSRKNHHIVKIDMPGYQPFEGTITHSVSGWIWGNIIFGGLIGLAVDAISGGIYKLSPDQMEATLQKNTTGYKMDGDVLYVYVTLQPDPNWERIGTMVPQVQ